MDKKVRKAVRTYLIEKNEVLAIKYKKDIIGYYDIPGGKIEDGETAEDASIREFKEETGIAIKKQHCIGHLVIEYPDIIFDLDIFIVDEYSGSLIESTKNEAMWISLVDLQNKENRISSIDAINYFKENMNLKIVCDSNHKILKIEEI